MKNFETDSFSYKKLIRINIFSLSVVFYLYIKNYKVRRRVPWLVIFFLCRSEAISSHFPPLLGQCGSLLAPANPSSKKWNNFPISRVFYGKILSILPIFFMSWWKKNLFRFIWFFSFFEIYSLMANSVIQILPKFFFLWVISNYRRVLNCTF